jgi:EAL domain-containing protein (putative c-di-GMP-specific phosphodiesterase class I)
MLLPALQPIVHGPTSEILAYEALARWRINDRILGPSDIHDALQWSNVDIEMLMGILARRDVVATVAPRLFINVSAGTIAESRRFAAWLGYLAEIADRATFAIVIEITEGIGDDKLQEAWPQIRRLGVKLALDDFGDGQSSRARLMRYDWDYCKFEGHTVVDPHVQEAIRYCRNSSILPIVERVERLETSSQFSEMGLHWQQGFLHGKPALIDDVVQKPWKPSRAEFATSIHA